MKTLKIFSLVAVMVLSTAAFAQKSKTETFKVSGNCGMCKSKIEKAAKEAGATSASWNEETKELTVKYSSATTNAARIQEKIAGAGYDNAGFKASLESYNKLHGCCKYERASDEKKECCGKKCEMKDGKCTDMSACKDKGCCDANGVCKAGENCKHEGQAHAGHEKSASCCKKDH